MKRLSIIAIAVSAWTVAGSPSHADFTTYSDFASWSSAVSGVETAVIPGHDGFAIGIGAAGVTYDEVHFDKTGGIIGSEEGVVLFNIGSTLSGQSRGILSSQSTIQGGVNLTIAFPELIQGFAVEFGTHFGGPVTFFLSTGYGFTRQSTDLGPYNLADFVGFTDTTPFDLVIISTFASGLDIADVSYARAAADPVPEPSTLVMLSSLGMTAFGVVRFRRRQKRRAAWNRR